MGIAPRNGSVDAPQPASQPEPAQLRQSIHLQQMKTSTLLKRALYALQAQTTPPALAAKRRLNRLKREAGDMRKLYHALESAYRKAGTTEAAEIYLSAYYQAATDYRAALAELSRAALDILS